tara:strand:+ start:196 stop:402 length:207 start_codon:yes stop_codon:yes gene_type:complete
VKTQVQLEVVKNEADLNQADKADNQKINLNDLLNRKKSEEKQKLKKNLAIFSLSIFVGLILIYFYNFF